MFITFFLLHIICKINIQKLIKIFLNLFSLYIKMTNKHYQNHKEKPRKEVRGRYQTHKERLRKEAPEKNKNLSEEEKDKRHKKVRGKHQNLPEE